MKTRLLFFVASALAACSSSSPDTLDPPSRAQLEPGGAVSLGAASGSSSGARSGSSASGGASPDAGSASDLQHCVDVINSYRATLSGAAPYARSSSLEQFAAAGATSDSQTGSPHGHFLATSGGNGIAFAENEVPGWPLDQYGSITAVIDQGMQMMWGEGPGGGHYDNMASTSYTQAGCGVAVTADGSVWITTDFR